jgi:hypothetical protein
LSCEVDECKPLGGGTLGKEKLAVKEEIGM